MLSILQRAKPRQPRVSPLLPTTQQPSYIHCFTTSKGYTNGAQSSRKRTSNMPTNLNGWGAIVLTRTTHEWPRPTSATALLQQFTGSKAFIFIFWKHGQQSCASPVSAIAAWHHHTYNFATTRHPNMPSWEERGSTNPSITSSAHTGLGTTDVNCIRYSTEYPAKPTSLIQRFHHSTNKKAADSQNTTQSHGDFMFAHTTGFSHLTEMDKFLSNLKTPWDSVLDNRLDLRRDSPTSHSDFKKAAPRADLTSVCGDQQFLLHRRHLFKAA